MEMLYEVQEELRHLHRIGKGQETLHHLIAGIRLRGQDQGMRGPRGPQVPILHPQEQGEAEEPQEAWPTFALFNEGELALADACLGSERPLAEVVGATGLPKLLATIAE
jgi:hypothetical protein